MTDWRPIDTAPKDGTHILVGDFTPGSIGFGRFAGEIVPTQTVAHWWAARGEEGFYPSVGSVQHFEPLRLTHWRPLPPAPMKLHFTREWLREKIASDPDGEPEAGAAVQPAAALDDCAARPAKGDYVLATKYDDGDPGDQWSVGFYDRTDERGRHYVTDADGKQFRGNGFRRVERIGPGRGAWLLERAQLIASSDRSLWDWARDPMRAAGNSPAATPPATEAKVCPNCDTALPEGCGGLFRDDGESCWLNSPADKSGAAP